MSTKKPNNPKTAEEANTNTTNLKTNSVSEAFIKNIAIGLSSKYKLSNQPYDNDESQIFLGRKQHLEKFKCFLNDSNNGIFLVTGFRGMGKTSFVKKVINQYKNPIEPEDHQPTKEDEKKTEPKKDNTNISYFGSKSA